MPSVVRPLVCVKSLYWLRTGNVTSEPLWRDVISDLLLSLIKGSSLFYWISWITVHYWCKKSPIFPRVEILVLVFPSLLNKTAFLSFFFIKMSLKNRSFDSSFRFSFSWSCILSLRLCYPTWDATQFSFLGSYWQSSRASETIVQDFSTFTFLDLCVLVKMWPIVDKARFATNDQIVWTLNL